MKNETNNTNIIEGRNPVIEAIRSGRSIDKLLIQTGEKNGSIRKVIALAKEKKIVITEADKAKLDKMGIYYGEDWITLQKNSKAKKKAAKKLGLTTKNYDCEYELSVSK